MEGVGGAVELGVSWRVEVRGGAAAAGLIQQSQGRLVQSPHGRHPEPGHRERGTLGLDEQHDKTYKTTGLGKKIYENSK